MLRLTCSIVLWGGRNTANKYHWSVWGVLAVSGPHWVCPNSQRVCFPGLHCSGSRLLSWELSKVGPGLHALPRSKPLRFRFWVLYKGTDLVGPVFCALPRSEQLRQQMLGQCTLCRCSASYHLPGPSLTVSWMCSGSAISGVPCVSFGELISGSNPPGRCQPSRIPGRFG